MREKIIGIDLGTTNSEVALSVDGKIEVLAVDGHEQLPSVVGIGEDGTLLVGMAARNQYALYPERTVRSVKREMGSDRRFTLGDQDYSPQEISALILGRLKAAAEARLGEPVHKAVITVPAYFSDAQRQATREAGAIAGLQVARIINEPTAAALTYESGHQGAKRILVYDLGGGTFDVSVVRMEDDNVEVLASHGNNHLGGDDFDQKIVEHVAAHLREQHDFDPETSLQVMARIRRAAETAKILLTDNPYALIEEEYLSERGGAPLHLSLELSRDDYNGMIEPFIEETLEAVHTALSGAGMAVSDLDEVLLVGGATRTPLIARRLEEILQLQPRSELNPDLCVASGAGIQAAVIAGEQAAGVLVDITPYTFGTSATGMLGGMEYPEVFVPLIRKNSVIPTTKSEVFYTMWDSQEAVNVKVYQGEAEDALENTLIGSFRIEGLSDAPAGNPIVTTFSLDLDGILNVHAKEKKSGLENSITIDNAFARFDDEHMAAAKARIGELLEGGTGPANPEQDQEQKQRREVTQAKALVEKARGLLDGVHEDDREDLIDAIEGIEDALNRGDDQALAVASEALTDLIYYLDA